ncbi:exodeoxyribonuclease III [Brevibacterium sp. BRM-1]|uniref:exodeoxyribonuclease III n=1 Tax=Brevibacterium sp. BRM-1 TaxID=2999062 RepID=UPI00227E5F1E|nr:exodeoxyribonuclease III [Brevibacterium sp. BRM-1]WAL41475.1 exodeoxyribonuclease III [Brevibacterium sp. BRM-1]
MIRIAGVNVNGIRAAMRKGMEPWAREAGAHLMTLQEVRAQDEVALSAMEPLGMHAHSADAEAKGRAGVAVLGRVPARAVRRGIGDEYFDRAGRWLEADYELADGSLLTLVSAYVHSGEAGTPKQEDKYRFMDRMLTRLPELREHADFALVTGDLNVGHTELDIKNWKANRKKAGFLPEERAYFDRFFGELGWVDVHRLLAGEVPGPYTWWSMRGQAFDNDAGWRIDYQLATPELAALARTARVDRAPSWGERWSDHAPLVIDYDLPDLQG